MKITHALAGIALTLTLAGCASEPEPEVDESSLVDVTEPMDDESDLGETDSETMDTVYLTVLRSEHPSDFVPVADADLIEIGHMICDQFDMGTSFEEVTSAAMQSGYDPGTAGFLIGSAITAYCPEHEGVF